MTTDPDIALAATLPALPPDPSVKSLVVILPGGRERHPGWRRRWLELGRHRKGPGALQRDLDGSHTIVGLTSWQADYIRGENK
jgi:hypothetical protein